MPLYRGSHRLRAFRRPVVGGVDAATTAWVNAVISAGGTVSGTQQTNVDTLIKAYKAAGVWTILDRVWLLASENSHQAQIDIVNLATWTLVGSPTFTANTGYTGGSAGNNLNTNFTPSTASGNYTQNSAHFGGYVKVGSGGGSTAIIGVNDGGFFSYLEPGGGIVGDINGATFVSGSNATEVGQYIVSRTSSTRVDFYKNDSATPIVTSTTDTSGAVATIPFYILKVNTFGHDYPGTVAAAQIGGALTSAQAAAAMVAMNAYQTAIGNNVY